MQRYAIYYAPEPGPFANFTAQWLGWDAEKGDTPARITLTGLPRDAEGLTADARKYGFHGTLKAPFRLAGDATEGALSAACAGMAASLPQVSMRGLVLQSLGGFLALVPMGDTSALSGLAEQIVLGLEAFRAPLTAAEIARRRPETLTPRQREMLTNYGYPYVLDQFQFHLTLTGPLSETDLAATKAALAPHLVPLVPQPFVLRDICLCAEGDDGLFRILHRYALTG